jgi:hypothetical protein
MSKLYRVLRTIEYIGSLENINAHMEMRGLKEKMINGGLIMKEKCHAPQELKTTEDIMNILEEGVK